MRGPPLRPLPPAVPTCPEAEAPAPPSPPPRVPTHSRQPPPRTKDPPACHVPAAQALSPEPSSRALSSCSVDGEGPGEGGLQPGHPQPGTASRGAPRGLVRAGSSPPEEQAQRVGRCGQRRRRGRPGLCALRRAGLSAAGRLPRRQEPLRRERPSATGVPADQPRRAAHSGAWTRGLQVRRVVSAWSRPGPGRGATRDVGSGS